MTETNRLALKFWGVRGSTPTPQSNNLSYGGNTPCVEIHVPDHPVIILDGGTGIRELGLHLVNERQGTPFSTKLFLTHFHWDHIQGIPFYPPLYDSQNVVSFYASGRNGGAEQMLTNQMQAPYFPVDLHLAAAKKEFFEIDEDEVQIGEVTVHPFPLNHPQGAMGYRAEFAGKTIVFATDVEHGDPELDMVLREYSQNADLLIYDAQFTPEEYERYREWGHSTWLEATRVAADSGVERLILFHHDPGHADDTMEEIVQSARRHFERTDAAREGTEIVLARSAATSSF